jgi:hypothetical protein
VNGLRLALGFSHPGHVVMCWRVELASLQRRHAGREALGRSRLRRARRGSALQRVFSEAVALKRSGFPVGAL